MTNYSGADINSFVETATREAAWGPKKADLVDWTHFEESYKQSKASLSKDDIAYYETIFEKFK